LSIANNGGLYSFAVKDTCGFKVLYEFLYFDGKKYSSIKFKPKIIIKKSYLR
jgi:hypothetical protein